MEMVDVNVDFIISDFNIRQDRTQIRVVQKKLSYIFCLVENMPKLKKFKFFFG